VVLLGPRPARPPYAPLILEDRGGWLKAPNKAPRLRLASSGCCVNRFLSSKTGRPTRVGAGAERNPCRPWTRSCGHTSASKNARWRGRGAVSFLTKIPEVMKLQPPHPVPE
jgi:hypothetical protein